VTAECRSTPATQRIGGPVEESSTDAKEKDKLRIVVKQLQLSKRNAMRCFDPSD